MPPEYWLVLTVAAGFMLLGVAGSPLVWVLFHHRRSRSEQIMEQMWRKLADDVHGLEIRLARLESIAPSNTRPRGRMRRGFLGGLEASRVDSPGEPTLIAVPNLEASPNDRDVSVHSIKERHSAIWALADTGAGPEVIARATGQPIGQIELVLGLRRQIDGTRTTFSHAPHG